MSKPKAASRLDLLIVQRAIMHTPADKLSATDKAVLVAILAHFNEDTGQCDPGVERLATMLGVKRHTVFRAISAAEALGLLERKSYGGKSHRNSYSPNWDACHKAVRDVEKRARATPRRSAPNSRTRGTVKAIHEQSHQRHGEQSHQGHTNVLARSNDVETYDVRAVAKAEWKQGHAEGSERHQRQGYLVHALPGGQASASRRRGSPRDAAASRLNAQLGQQPDKLALWQSSPAAWERAVDAEMQRRGDGLTALRLDPERLAVADAKAAGFG